MPRAVTSRRSVAIAFCSLCAIAMFPFAARRGLAVEKPGNTQAPITSEQWSKILARIRDKGIRRTLPQRVTAHLGLTKGNETLSVLELAVEREGYQHGIYVDPWLGPDHLYFIFAFRNPEKKWMGFVADPHLALTSAATWSSGGNPEPVPVAQAQSVFDNELAYWAVLADLF